MRHASRPSSGSSYVCGCRRRNPVARAGSTTCRRFIRSTRWDLSLVYILGFRPAALQVPSGQVQGPTKARPTGKPLQDSTQPALGGRLRHSPFPAQPSALPAAPRFCDRAVTEHSALGVHVSRSAKRGKSLCSGILRRKLVLVYRRGRIRPSVTYLVETIDRLNERQLT